MMGQLLGGQQLLFYSFNLEDHVLALRSRPSAGAEHFRPHGAIRHLQHYRMRISQGKHLDLWCPFLVLTQQVQGKRWHYFR